MTRLLLEDIHRLHTPNAAHAVVAVLEQLEQYQLTRNYFHLESALLSAQNTHWSLQTIQHYLKHTAG